jgi:hypothetical protein
VNSGTAQTDESLFLFIEHQKYISEQTGEKNAEHVSPAQTRANGET